MHPNLLTVVVAAVVAAAVGFGFGQVSSPPAADAQADRAVVKELKRLNKRVTLLWIRAKETNFELRGIRSDLSYGLGNRGFLRRSVRELLYSICWNTGSVQQREVC